jgi:hypothetical protein
MLDRTPVMRLNSIHFSATDKEKLNSPSIVIAIELKRRSVQSWRFLRLRSDGFRIFSLHAPNPQLELLR